MAYFWLLTVFSFNEKSSVLLLFSANALLLSFLILSRTRKDRQEANWLGFFGLLSVGYMAPFMLGYAGWYAEKWSRNILFFVPFQQLFFIGPVLFFYSKELAKVKSSGSRYDVYHFLPGFIYLAFILGVFVLEVFYYGEPTLYADGKDMDLDPWYQWTGFVSLFLYLILSIGHYVQYRKEIVDYYSFAEAIKYRWLGRFLIAFSALLVARLLFFILNPEWGEFGSKFWYYVCFGVLSNFILFSGYLQLIRNDLNWISIRENENAQEEIEPEEKIGENNRAVSQSDEKMVAHLEDIMRNGLYKNPMLTLQEVAQIADTNTKTVSSIVNRAFKVNFNDE